MKQAHAVLSKVATPTSYSLTVAALTMELPNENHFFGGVVERARGDGTTGIDPLSFLTSFLKRLFAFIMQHGRFGIGWTCILGLCVDAVLSIAADQDQDVNSEEVAARLEVIHQKLHVYVDKLNGTDLQEVPPNYQNFVVISRVNATGRWRNSTKTEGRKRLMDILNKYKPNYEDARAQGSYDELDRVMSTVLSLLEDNQCEYNNDDGTSGLSRVQFIRCEGKPHSWPEEPNQDDIVKDPRKDQSLMRMMHVLLLKSEEVSEPLPQQVECLDCLESQRIYGFDPTNEKDAWIWRHPDGTELDTDKEDLPTLERAHIEHITIDATGVAPMMDIMDEILVKQGGELCILDGDTTPRQVQKGIPMYLQENTKQLKLPTFKYGDYRTHNNTPHSAKSNRELCDSIDMSQVMSFTRPRDGATVTYTVETCKHAWCSELYGPGDQWKTKLEFRWFPWSILWFLFCPFPCLRYPIGIVRRYPGGKWYEVRYGKESGMKVNIKTLWRMIFCLITVLIQILLSNLGDQKIRRTPVNPKKDPAYIFVQPAGTTKVFGYPMKIRNVLGSMLSLDLVYVAGGNLFSKTMKSRKSVKYVSLLDLHRVKYGQELPVWTPQAEDDDGMDEYESDDDEDCAE